MRIAAHILHTTTVSDIVWMYSQNSFCFKHCNYFTISSNAYQFCTHTQSIPANISIHWRVACYSSCCESAFSFAANLKLNIAKYAIRIHYTIVNKVSFASMSAGVYSDSNPIKFYPWQDSKLCHMNCERKREKETAKNVSSSKFYWTDIFAINKCRIHCSRA